MLTLILILVVLIGLSVGSIKIQLKEITMKLSEALTAVGELETSLDEASTEILAELEKLRSTDPDLSPEGAALVERVRAKAKGLADIIPNAPPA